MSSRAKRRTLTPKEGREQPRNRGAGAAPPTKPTMHDVARLAGVSIATVSALINGAPRVSEARAERIQRAMEALNYHRDQIARSLKVGRTQTIGVVIPDITNAFYPAVFRGIEDSARAARYEVLLCNSNESAEHERIHLSTLVARRVDGVLLACSSGSSVREASLHGRLPLVFLDRIPHGVIGTAVGTDDVEAARVATNHLIELGHRRIALLAGNLDLSPHVDRLAGFRLAMGNAGLPVQERYVRVGGMQVEDGKAAAQGLLQLDLPPTAIVVSNTKLLLGVLHLFRERQIAVPRRVSLITFDEHEWNEYLNPPITAIVQQTHEIGRRAFELLRAKIEQASAGNQESTTKLAAELRIRGSTAAPNAS